MIAAKLLEAIALIGKDNMLAADKLTDVANQLLSWAEKLRWQTVNAPDPGGISDKVKIRVCGPDGTVKQETET